MGHFRESAAVQNATFVDNVKRLMGRAYDESITHQLGYATAKLEDGKIGINCQHSNSHTLTVPEVSSEVLKVRLVSSVSCLHRTPPSRVQHTPQEGGKPNTHGDAQTIQLKRVRLS